MLKKICLNCMTWSGEDGKAQNVVCYRDGVRPNDVVEMRRSEDLQLDYLFPRSVRPACFQGMPAGVVGWHNVMTLGK